MISTEYLQVFALSEYEEKLVEDLDSDVVANIQKTELVELSRKVTGEFVLKAGSKIGFVSVQGVQVNVKPRFPIYNIFYFLGFWDALRLEKEKVKIDKSADFLTVLFQSFLTNVEEATRKGLINGYVNQEETSKVLKGRIDFSRQFKKHPGSYFPFEVSFDDYVEDVPENQILKKALQIALKYGLKERELKNRAQNLLFNFKEVSDLSEAISWSSSRLNKHYWDALQIADLIISGNGFHENVGNVQINGFSVDMHRIFEGFVAKQLASRVNKIKGESNWIKKQEKMYLDTQEKYKQIADIVWYREDKPFQVLDTKYKAPEGENEQKDSLNDLRQVISYASLLRLKQAHLIYGVAGDPRSIESNQEGITVFTHGLDLSQSPDHIGKQLDLIVETLRRSETSSN